MTSKKNKSNQPIVEIAIIIIIAICMVFLNCFANNKFNELMEVSNEALLISHDPDNPVHQELAELITEYRPEACKMIEVYSEDFDQLFTVQFRLQEDTHEADLNAYTELATLLRTNKEGHTTVTIDDVEEDVYFQWVETSKGDPYLIMIYMSRPIVHDLWIFTFVCNLVVILVGVLLMYIMLLHRRDNIKSYEFIRKELANSLKGSLK